MVKSKDGEVRLGVNSSFISYWLNDLGQLLNLSLKPCFCEMGVTVVSTYDDVVRAS